MFDRLFSMCVPHGDDPTSTPTSRDVLAQRELGAHFEDAHDCLIGFRADSVGLLAGLKGL